MHLSDYTTRGTSNGCLPSTTWHFEDGSLDGPGGPIWQSRPEGPSIHALRALDPRRSLDLQVRMLRGPEDLWQIQARGWRWKFSGHLAVRDVMWWIERLDGHR